MFLALYPECLSHNLFWRILAVYILGVVTGEANRIWAIEDWTCVVLRHQVSIERRLLG